LGEQDNPSHVNFYPYKTRQKLGMGG